MKILLIEDDPLLGENLKEFLEQNGCITEWIQDERDLIDPSVVMVYDVVILDLMLRYSRGEDLLREIRSRGITTPVIVLTAKNTFLDKETCFNLGADDYITKPFEPRELILRIKAILRRLRDKDKVMIGDAEVDSDSMTVRYKGKEFKLSKTSWELLNLLLKNRGKVVSTDTILNCVWGDKPVGNEVVRAYIKELRKMLPPGSIETHKGIGYKLV